MKPQIFEREDLIPHYLNTEWLTSEDQIDARMTTAECVIARRNYLQGKGILRVDSKRRMSAPSSLIQVKYFTYSYNFMLTNH